jgi:hypothetical protein
MPLLPQSCPLETDIFKEVSFQSESIETNGVIFSEFYFQFDFKRIRCQWNANLLL